MSIYTYELDSYLFFKNLINFLWLHNSFINKPGCYVLKIDYALILKQISAAFEKCN